MTNPIISKKKFNTLYTSILFAIFIVIGISHFLLGFKSALIVGSVIPLTIFLVLFGCTLLGLPLHQTSMTGIIIALGLLIDNAIIVVEDFKYRRKLGHSREKASFETFQHLWIPLLQRQPQQQHYLFFLLLQAKVLVESL